jgi:hypothetical protein
MEKEIVPETNIPTKTPEYKSIEKEAARESIEKIVPNHLIPSKRLATILALVFLAVISLAIIQLPYSEIMKGNLEIEIGYPLTFLDFKTTTEELPIKPLNLTIDIIIYLIISYIIDIFLTFIISTNTTKIRQQEGKGPKVYETQK